MIRGRRYPLDWFLNPRFFQLPVESVELGISRKMSRSLVVVEPAFWEPVRQTSYTLENYDKKEVWKVIFLRKWMTFSFHVNFQGCIPVFFSAGNSRTSTKLGVVWAMVVSVPCRFSQGGPLSAVWLEDVLVSFGAPLLEDFLRVVI